MFGEIVSIKLIRICLKARSQLQPFLQVLTQLKDKVAQTNPKTTSWSHTLQSLPLTVRKIDLMILRIPLQGMKVSPINHHRCSLGFPHPNRNLILGNRTSTLNRWEDCPRKNPILPKMGNLSSHFLVFSSSN